MGLALAGAARHRLQLPQLETIEAHWREAIAQGHGDEDVAAVIATLRRE